MNKNLRIILTLYFIMLRNQIKRIEKKNMKRIEKRLERTDLKKTTYDITSKTAFHNRLIITINLKFKIYKILKIRYNRKCV